MMVQVGSRHSAVLHDESSLWAIIQFSTTSRVGWVSKCTYLSGFLCCGKLEGLLTPAHYARKRSTSVCELVVLFVEALFGGSRNPSIRPQVMTTYSSGKEKGLQL